MNDSFYDPYLMYNMSPMMKGMPDKPSPVKVEPKIGRNKLCICGSGRKHKHCCMTQLT